MGRAMAVFCMQAGGRIGGLWLPDARPAIPVWLPPPAYPGQAVGIYTSGATGAPCKAKVNFDF